MKRLLYLPACLMLLALTLTTVGCGPENAPSAAKPAAGDAHEHDHEDLKTGNFGESVGSLRKLHDEIKAAFDKNNPEEAHHALHDIGHVLEALEGQVKSLPEDKQAAAKEAVAALFDGYSKLDEGMHGGTAAKYADWGTKLADSLKTLESSKP